MEILKTTCYKGTVIRIGNEKRRLLNKISKLLMGAGFLEISIPIIQFEETFTGKVGEENNNLMFRLSDSKNRKLCLAPEYTAVIQKLSQQDFKYRNDVGLFYIQECFRGERQQRGRWRQFTQLGVENLNPKIIKMEDLIKLAIDLVSMSGVGFEVNTDVVRGLDYYKDGRGFEIRSKDGLQLCGGGEYDGGIGFAVGVDRLFV